MSGHTPGPWHVHKANRWSHVKSANGDYVMEGNYRGVARQHADARLIAASPRMYEYIAQRAKEGDDDAASIIADI